MALDGDACAVLEAIAFGNDPRITPSDRLRALEQLQAFPDQEAADVREILAGMSPEEIAFEWDLFCGAEVVQEALNESGKNAYPRMAAAIREAVEQRASEIVSGRVRSGFEASGTGEVSASR